MPKPLPRRTCSASACYVVAAILDAVENLNFPRGMATRNTELKVKTARNSAGRGVRLAWELSPDFIGDLSGPTGKGRGNLLVSKSRSRRENVVGEGTEHAPRA